VYVDGQISAKPGKGKNIASMTVTRKDDLQNGAQLMSSKMMKNDYNQSGYDIDLGRQTIKPPSLSPSKQTTDTPRTRTRKSKCIETTIKPTIHVKPIGSSTRGGTTN
jgi:hypothetical protein